MYHRNGRDSFGTGAFVTFAPAPPGQSWNVGLMKKHRFTSRLALIGSIVHTQAPLRKSCSGVSEGERNLAKDIVHREEGLEGALKRFKRYVDKDGIMSDYSRSTAFRSKAERRHAKEQHKKR